eukprot:6696722-Karenia_brevis.AAC.1
MRLRHHRESASARPRVICSQPLSAVSGLSTSGGDRQLEGQSVDPTGPTHTSSLLDSSSRCSR